MASKSWRTPDSALAAAICCFPARSRCRLSLEAGLNSMKTWFIVPTLTVSLFAQVKTEVPQPVAGAKPVAVERIKIHGAALEGNLEGDAVDRDVLVFLPPGYATQK